MNKIINAMAQALGLWMEENEKAPENGDEFATVFNDCVLITKVENDTLKQSFLIGEPYRIHENVFSVVVELGDSDEVDTAE